MKITKWIKNFIQASVLKTFLERNEMFLFFNGKYKYNYVQNAKITNKITTYYIVYKILHAILSYYNALKLMYKFSFVYLVPFAQH
jgi:hypothetical protein